MRPHFYSCIFNLLVLQPKRILMELQELSDGSAVLPAVLGWHTLTQQISHGDEDNEGWECSRDIISY